jgi:hypothetical protein
MDGILSDDLLRSVLNRACDSWPQRWAVLRVCRRWEAIAREGSNLGVELVLMPGWPRHMLTMAPARASDDGQRRIQVQLAFFHGHVYEFAQQSMFRVLNLLRSAYRLTVSQVCVASVRLTGVAVPMSALASLFFHMSILQDPSASGGALHPCLGGLAACSRLQQVGLDRVELPQRLAEALSWATSLTSLHLWNCPIEGAGHGSSSCPERAHLVHSLSTHPSLTELAWAGDVHSAPLEFLWVPPARKLKRLALSFASYVHAGHELVASRLDFEECFQARGLQHRSDMSDVSLLDPPTHYLLAAPWEPPQALESLVLLDKGLASPGLTSSIAACIASPAWRGLTELHLSGSSLTMLLTAYISPHDLATCLPSLRALGTLELSWNAPDWFWTAGCMPTEMDGQAPLQPLPVAPPLLPHLRQLTVFCNSPGGAADYTSVDWGERCALRRICEDLCWFVPRLERLFLEWFIDSQEPGHILNDLSGLARALSPLAGCDALREVHLLRYCHSCTQLDSGNQFREAADPALTGALALAAMGSGVLPPGCKLHVHDDPQQASSTSDMFEEFEWALQDAVGEYPLTRGLSSILQYN